MPVGSSTASPSVLFNSYIFLLAFLPVTLAGWWLIRPIPWRLIWLCSMSYLFYGYWDWRFVPLMLATTLVDYFAGRAIAARSSIQSRLPLLVLSLTFNLGLLAFFKYAGFVERTVNALAALVGQPGLLPAVNLLLPLGISFYIFESISYTIDIYRGEAQPARSLLHYALFISIFPKLIAGPIIRYTDVEEQYRHLPTAPRAEWLWKGVIFFVVGMTKKVLIADTIAAYINPILDAGAPGTLALGWLTLMGYGLQIYFDFSGYSDMAVGLGFLLGFRFPQNFDRPYLARNISEFWSRWHITLSRWLRDYLFIPLGGSRCGKARTARNLFLTMFLGGLWHGASWMFVGWGLYQGVLLAGYHAIRGRTSVVLPTWCCRAMLCLAVAIGWVLFRSPDLQFAGAWYSSLVGLQPVGSSVVLGKRFCLLLLGCAAWIASVPEPWDLSLPPRRRYAMALATAATVCILQLSRESPFLYFQF
jgi:alginate O-acetyltransferase complex protein AlgI